MRSSLPGFNGVRRLGIASDPATKGGGEATTVVGVDGQLPATTIRHCANYAVAY